jgi:outer membrane protein
MKLNTILKQGILVCGLAFAVTAQAEMKIGVVDLRVIMAKSPQANAVNEKLFNEFHSREEDIAASEKKLEEKADKLKRDSAVLAEAERTKLEKEILTKQRDLQRVQAEFRDDVQIRQREEMQKFMQLFETKLAKIAQQENYDIILHSDAVPFSTAKVNITDKVLAQL